ncbi:MAG: hypothetical protein ACK5NN_04235 [Sphingomonadaceae bacterium]
MFTDQRFHAWFAGIATLSDQPPRGARPPRVLCEAILTELAHSSWALLAELAIRFQTALLAPSDHLDDDLSAGTAHQDIYAIIAAARCLIEELPPSPHPLNAVTRLCREAGKHILFAPPERVPVPIAPGGIRLTVERAPLPSPRWALEMLWGEHWRAARLLPHALPFPGLIRLDALHIDTPHSDVEPDERAEILASSLRDTAQALFDSLNEANQLVSRLTDLQPGQRRSSRAPALLALLTGFGPLRSSQLELLLGASRLGVRSMLAALGRIGVLERRTLAGVHLYTANLDSRPLIEHGQPAASSPFSSAALDEYNAAMGDIEALLARHNVGRDEDEREDDV